MSDTLDEWVEKNAADLKQQIECHLDVFTDHIQEMPEEDRETLARLIMISVRNWDEQRGRKK